MRVVEIETIIQEVEVPSVNRVYRCGDSHGAEWAVKDCPNSGAFADALGLSLARALGIRSPEPGIVRLRGLLRDDPRLRDHMLAVAWIGEERDDAHVSHWSPDLTLAKPSEIGEIMALDVLLGVADRHERNLLVREVEGQRGAQLWVIDYDNASITSPDALAMNPVQLMELEGLDLAAVRTGAQDLLAKLERILITRNGHESGRRLLAGVVEGVIEFGRGIQIDEVRELLYARCADAHELVWASLPR